MATTPDAYTQAREKQEQLRGKAFRMMLELIGIIGIPAVVGAVIGTRLDAQFNDGNKLWVIVCLFAALIVSWAIVIRKYKKLVIESRAADQALRDAKQDLVKQSPLTDTQK